MTLEVGCVGQFDLSRYLSVLALRTIGVYFRNRGYIIFAFLNRKDRW